jgi:alpha-D-ribose 1-methylphosphonate 5-triphosphate synthase subunit PhnH
MSVELPGFVDPVSGAQGCFRAVLAAMASPGSVHAAGEGLSPPAPLGSAMAAVLLSLVDGDSTLALEGDYAAAQDWLVFHCGAEMEDDPAAAAFVVARTLPDMATLSTGSDEAPEDAATLLLEVAGFGEGQKLLLSGPGLAAPTEFQVAGLPADFAVAWARNHALFPRGVDIILCAGTRLAALPRSLRITEGAG